MGDSEIESDVDGDLEDYVQHNIGIGQQAEDNDEDILMDVIIMSEESEPSRPSEPEAIPSEISGSRIGKNVDANNGNPKFETIRSVLADVDFPRNWHYLKPYYKCNKFVVDKENYRLSKVTAGCRKCGQEISAELSSASNFKRHFRTKHETVIKADEENRGSTEFASRKSQQLTLGKSVLRVKTQKHLTENVTKYIYGGIHSFSNVEEENFIHLIQSLLPEESQLYVPSRKQVGNQMDQDFAAHKQKLKGIFKELDFLAITADVWKCHKRAFLGVMVHWIDKQTLGRKMAVLLLKRLQDEITFKEIGTSINAVMKEFVILNKVVLCTTDNGSNFIKAFRVFADSYSYEKIETPELENDHDDDEVEFIEVHPMWEKFESGENNDTIELPPHCRCSAHTLNLIMSTDANKFNDPSKRNTITESDEEGAIEFVKTSNEVFQKCKLLWNAQSRTTKTADFIHRELGIYLPVPNDTRWCSFYRAIQTILIYSKQLRNIVGPKCGIRFVKEDFIFLQEYCDIMKLFADALDTLQGENRAYFGIFLPTLYSLRRKLKLLRTSGFTYCSEFLEHMISALETRFESDWTCERYLIASVVHPAFKLNFIKDTAIEQIAKDAILMIQSSCSDHNQNQNLKRNLDAQKKKRNQSGDVIFDFPTSSSGPQTSSVNGCGLDEYLKDSMELDILHQYSCIKKLFLHYNTGLPSSASVERTFSIAGDIFGKKRARLGDQRFEAQVSLNVGIRKL